MGLRSRYGQAYTHMLYGCSMAVVCSLVVCYRRSQAPLGRISGGLRDVGRNVDGDQLKAQARRDDSVGGGEQAAWSTVARWAPRKAVVGR